MTTYTLTAFPGAFFMNGAPATSSFELDVSPGSFVMTGGYATLSYSGGTSPYWDFSDASMTFDNPAYLFDGTIIQPVPPGGLMPNIVGVNLYEALQLLQEAGAYVPSQIGYFGTFPIVVTWVQTPGATPGNVLTQVPTSGSPFIPNQTVALTVEIFSPAVAFP